MRLVAKRLTKKETFWLGVIYALGTVLGFALTQGWKLW
jgi:hypothetical protein